MLAAGCLPFINVRHLLRLPHLRRMLIAGKYILGDGIVVWRAWVLWGPSRRFTLFTPPILSLVCMLGELKQFETLFSVDRSISVLAVVGAAFMYLSNAYQLNPEAAVSRHLGWSVGALSLCTNLWATSLIFIRMWHVSLRHSYLAPYVITRYILQAIQAGRTMFPWQGYCCIQSRESPFFHGRVWGALSLHLGMFCFPCCHLVR